MKRGVWALSFDLSGTSKLALTLTRQSDFAGRTHRNLIADLDYRARAWRSNDAGRRRDTARVIRGADTGDGYGTFYICTGRVTACGVRTSGNGFRCPDPVIAS